VLAHKTHVDDTCMRVCYLLWLGMVVCARAPCNHNRRLLNGAVLPLSSALSRAWSRWGCCYGLNG
jgi:hypothetical protein